MRKKITITHVIIAVHTELSTYQLCDKSKDTCNKHKISASSKETIIEHTKRIGMISGPHVQLVSTMKYNEILINNLGGTTNLIETRKQIVYERNMRLNDSSICS